MGTGAAEIWDQMLVIDNAPELHQELRWEAELMPDRPSRHRGHAHRRRLVLEHVDSRTVRARCRGAGAVYAVQFDCRRGVGLFVSRSRPLRPFVAAQLVTAPLAELVA